MERETLLRTEGTFHPFMHYSHVTFLIPVEKCYDTIDVELKYAPLFFDGKDPELETMMRAALKDQIMRTDEDYVQEVMKKCMPIKNQISIAINGPDGWRGEHHFFPGEQVVTISGSNSTDGFVNAKNGAGLYEIVLHVFAVYNDVNYSMKVTGGNK